MYKLIKINEKLNKYIKIITISRFQIIKFYKPNTNNNRYKLKLM